MPTTFFARRGGEGASPGPVIPVRVGQLYLDVQRRGIHCLNDTARQLVKEGVPVNREGLERHPMRTLAGEPVTIDDLPLYRAGREGVPVEATYVLARPGALHHVTWSAAPLRGPGGQVQGVTASVCLSVPEPDWQHLAGLAHDLRSPLQALRLLVPLLETTPFLHPEAAEALDRLRVSSDRALAVGLELLEWVRAPLTGAPPVRRDWVPLGPMLKGLADEQQPMAQRKGLSLKLDVSAAQKLEAHTDRARLQRLLTNLLSNAVRYTPAGEVCLTASWRLDAAGRREALSLGVMDTGPGIAPEEQDSIFQPFERGKMAKEGGGSGLGLAVVDRLVKELGLTLEVFSEFGRGSNFEVLLPPGGLREKKG
jgi:hypothetical protein